MRKAWGKGKTIVIIDDSVDFSSTLATLLDRSGFIGERHFYPYADVFFRKSDDFTPDLVISDLCLPIITGEEVYRFVRDKFPESEFILVSGDVHELEEAVHDAQYNFFVKPITAKPFLEKVQSCLN